MFFLYQLLISVFLLAFLKVAAKSLKVWQWKCIERKRRRKNWFVGGNGQMMWRDEHSSSLCPPASSYVCFLWWCVHITDVLSNAAICNLSFPSLSLSLSYPRDSVFLKCVNLGLLAQVQTFSPETAICLQLTRQRDQNRRKYPKKWRAEQER